MWCRSVLAPALQSATEDRPSVWTAFGKRRPAGIRVLIDTLQLSGTLRDAVPYEIRVDRHLVEPLLAEPRSDQRIRLLHISDLHLAADLSEPGRKLARPVLAPTHSFDTARFVASAVSSLQPRYDAVVATGDLTTDGARESFETVLQYVQSGSITGANPMRIAAYGLNASRSQRILLPGNHDRYAGATVTGQRLDLTCEEVLGTPRGYPYLLGYRPHGREADSLTLLFLVFDSSLQAGRGSGLSPADWARALAKGEIRDAELLQARKLIENKAAQPRVERIGGGFIDFNPGKTLRIALLHHHPVTKYAKPATPGDSSTFFGWMKEKLVKPVQDYQGQQVAENMAMENSDAFLRCCFDCGIQLVLFGHQHDPYQRLILDKVTPAAASPFGPGAGYMRAFCCPTTLQYDAPANGFYVFDFESETRVEWSMHGNQRVDGQPAAPMKLLQRKSFDLSVPPSAEELEECYALEH
nr:metallophosphoesterase [Caldimonas mangrovi]